MGLFILPRTNAAAHRHPQRTCLAALALACLLTASAGTLAGCASSHPITKSGEQCASCHSDGRAAVEGTGSASATETGLTFAVESGAGEVYLCTAAVAEDGTVTGTPDRSTLRAVQTPQVFETDLLKAALQSALENEVPVTDDCAAVERLGKVVYLIDGDEENLKITTPVDLVIAEAILAEREGR